MSCADAVRRARNPQEAMLAVAEGIDAILSKLDEKPTADGWGEWSPEIITTEAVKERYVDTMAKHGIEVKPAGKWSDPAVAQAMMNHVTAAPAKPSAEAVQALKDKIVSETDPETRLALEAQLRLLTDTGDTPFAVAEGHRAEADEDGIVELPPVDLARKQARHDWALGFKLGDMMDPPMDNDQAAKAYAIGGPMWLYLPQRKTIMGLPEHVRRMMVEDVERDSPAQAQELGRDILKSFEPNTQDVTIETMANQHSGD